MKIHTISTYQEFTEEEIQEVENYIVKTLKPLQKQLEGCEGTIFISVKSEETTFKLIGFSPLLFIQITRLLRKTKF